MHHTCQLTPECSTFSHTHTRTHMDAVGHWYQLHRQVSPASSGAHGGDCTPPARSKLGGRDGDWLGGRKQARRGK
jgi:putative component of membrane protein insertase Oxa1/YidC/SpoIIIJ protein YidD